MKQGWRWHRSVRCASSIKFHSTSETCSVLHTQTAYEAQWEEQDATYQSACGVLLLNGMTTASCTHAYMRIIGWDG